MFGFADLLSNLMVLGLVVRDESWGTASNCP